MANTYVQDSNNSTLAATLAASPNSRQDAITAYFHKASAQHNALMAFTSTFDPNSQNGGVTSIFAQKTELAAGGKSRVHFNTIGLPAGDGARGAGILTGNESKSSINTYSVAVDWVRDAVSLSEDEVQMIEAGRNLKATLMQLLAKKMGLTKQNHMLRRLIDSAYNLNSQVSINGVAGAAANWLNGTHRGNVYRVGNRSSFDALLATDKLSLDTTNTCRSLLNTLGATPLKKSTATSGCPISKFLLFAGDNAMLPIRNDSAFNTSVANADVRGDGNALRTGEILDWQGNPFYEMPITDMAWDDYKGGPLLAKAKTVLSASQSPATVGGPILSFGSNSNSFYTQWFNGYRYPFNRLETLPDLSTQEYYAWACNPDGSRVFFAYAGNHNGKTLTITKILAPALTGTTIDAVSVGNLSVGGSATRAAADTAGVFTPAGAAASGKRTLPLTGTNGAWVYSDTIATGAIILQANANGAVCTRSFMLASMAGMFANGAIKMAEIEQNFDYDFVMGKGYQMIFGTGIALDPLGIPNGYILIEHAIDVVGYSCPVASAIGAAVA
jgi:hypothetical protein